MKRHVFISILVFFVVLSGCEKQNQGNGGPGYVAYTYFPVYPGSYWKYIAGNDTLTSRASDTLGFLLGDSLPVLDGDLIKHYQKWISYGLYNTGWSTILSENVGESFGISFGDPRTYPVHESTRVIQKTRDNNGDSILVQKMVTYSPGPYSVPLREWVYQVYKKYVGLSFECGIDSITKDTNWKKALYKYHINWSRKL